MEPAVCFQGRGWSDVKTVLIKAAGMLQRWKILCKDSDGARLEAVRDEMDRRAKEPAKIIWQQAAVTCSTTSESSATPITHHSSVGPPVL